MNPTNQRRRIAGEVLFSIAFNALLPYLLYVLLKPHMETLTALLIATAAPLVENIVHFARHRRLDAFGMLMLSVFVISLLLVALGGDERAVLIRESFVTAMVGLWFLLSLLGKRPLMYHLAFRFTVGASPEEREVFAGRWQIPYFRRVLRLMTLVWGTLFAGEACLRTLLVYRLSVERFLLVSPIAFYGCLGILIGWTIAYRRISQKKLRTIMGSSAHHAAAGHMKVESN